MKTARLTRPAYAPVVALFVVAGVWMVVQRLSMGLNFPLGYDESVYVSQVSTHPHMYWSAPRAFGLPLLLWPVVHWTTSTVALRLYVSALTAGGLVLGYLPWTRARGWVAPLAALLFTSLWVSTFYASLAMPNLFTALAAVAAVGWVVRSIEDGRDRSRVWAAVALAVMSLVRPSDATYVAVPLLVAAALISARGRRRTITAIVAGTAVGWAFWIVEAFINFGGPLQRLHDAGAQDAGGLHWNLPFFSDVISGPTACCIAVNEPLVANVWWWALWPLAILGVVSASGALRRAYLLCVVTAASVFLQYLFLIKVEAPGPRTLLPVYALLALPVAQVLAVVVRWRRGSVAGGLAIAGLVLGFGGQAAIQQHVLRINVRQQRTRQSVPRLVAQQLRAAGVSPPCDLAGPELPQVAYQAGCHELRDLPGPAEVAQARKDGNTLAVLLWSEESIDEYQADYDRLLVGYTVTKLPRPDGRLSYLYRPPP